MKRLSTTSVAVGQAVPDARHHCAQNPARPVACRSRTTCLVRHSVRHSLTYGRPAYTLVEMLLSVTLALIMMAFVMQIFGMVGDSVNDARALVELNDRLRWTGERLRKDLDCATAEMTPPLSPESGQGYFEYIEGPVGPVRLVEMVALNASAPNPTPPPSYLSDTTTIDSDDVLMLTVQNRDEPFVGRVAVRTAAGTQRISTQSEFAEVAWFIRGTTLYRRVLLIKPDVDPDQTTPGVQEPLSYPNLYDSPGGLLASIVPALRGFYNQFDLSVRWRGTAGNTATWIWELNSLADLTKRENRFAHQPANNVYPFSPHAGSDWQYLGLPTLCETSFVTWWPGTPLPVVVLTLPASPPSPFSFVGQFDAWNNPLPYESVNLGGTPTALDPDTGAIQAIAGPRVAEDVILTNVIGFDVKAWDPGAPLLSIDPNGTPNDLTDDVACLAPGEPGYPAAYALYAAGQPGAVVAARGMYVDLGYGPINNVPAGTSLFSGPGNVPTLPRVYDTWSVHYEKDGVDQDGALIDEGTDGFDNDGDGTVDELDEQEARPPYPVPLRGIQIKLRVFDPDSRQVREVTITHDFSHK